MGSYSNKGGFNLFLGWFWPVSHGTDLSVLADFHSLTMLFSEVKARLTLCPFHTWPMEFESHLLRKVKLLLAPLSLTPSRIDLYLCFLLLTLRLYFQ